MNIQQIRAELEKGKTLNDLELRVTYYARTANGDIESQQTYLEKLIKSQSKWTYVDGYADENKSGLDALNRDDLNRMLDDSKSDMFDLIVIYDTSKLSRNRTEVENYSVKFLENGVCILFVVEDINTIQLASKLQTIEVKRLQINLKTI